MSETPERPRGRLWLTVGEGAAVLAVIIAGLNYWDSHHERVDQARRAAAAARQADLASTLVLEASVQDGGRRLALRSVAPGQVIESQRYVFPSPIRQGPVDVTAQAPEIDSAWISAGLAKALDARHAKAEGRGRLPVAIVTAYVENGEARRDSALYVVGFAWKRRFLGGREISLSGVALRNRLPAGDPQAALDKAWASESCCAAPSPALLRTSHE